MNIKRTATQLIHNNPRRMLGNVAKRQDTIIWGMTATVPFLRSAVDHKEEKKHFKRDLVTFMGGTMAYLGGVSASAALLRKGSLKKLQGLSSEAKKSISTMAGMVSWLSCITFGTSKLPKKLGKKTDEKTNVKHPQMPAWPKMNISGTEGNKEVNPFVQKGTSATFQISSPTKSNPYYLYSLTKHSRGLVNQPLWRK